MKIDEDTPDYFEGDDIPETPKEKRQRFADDDPRRWLQPAGKWDHLKFLTRWRVWVYLGMAIVVICILHALFVALFVPKTEGCVQYGYIENIDRYNGRITKSFEGVMIPYREIMDTTRVYRSDFIFSTKDATVAATLKKIMLANLPAVVEYKEYRTTMPWRGNTRIIITGADSVSPSRLLPPEYQPASLHELKSPSRQ